MWLSTTGNRRLPHCSSGAPESLRVRRPLLRRSPPAGAPVVVLETGFCSCAAQFADMPIPSGRTLLHTGPLHINPGNIHVCAEAAQPPLVLIDAGLVGHRIPIPWDALWAGQDVAEGRPPEAWQRVHSLVLAVSAVWECPGAAWWRRRGWVEFAAGHPEVLANGSVRPLVSIGRAITKMGSKVYSFPAAMTQQDPEQFFSEVEWTRTSSRSASAASVKNASCSPPASLAKTAQPRPSSSRRRPDRLPASQDQPRQRRAPIPHPRLRRRSASADVNPPPHTAGAKPARSVVDFTATCHRARYRQQVNALARQHQVNFIAHIGYTRLLKQHPVPKPRCDCEACDP